MAKQEKQDPTDSSSASPAWASLHLWHMQPVRDVLLGLGIFALILLAQKASVVTVPLLLAILLAYLFEPVICWLMNRFKFSRRTSVIGIIASVIIFIVIPAVLATIFATGQLVTFTTDTIEDIGHLNAAMDQEQKSSTGTEYINNNTSAPWPWIYEQVELSKSINANKNTQEVDPGAEVFTDQSTPIGDVFAFVAMWVDGNQEELTQTAAGVGVTVMNSLVSFVGALFGFGFLAFVTGFFFFFTATEWVGLKRFGVDLLPDKNRGTIVMLLVKFDHVISGFIRGRITIAFIQAIIFSIGFFLIGVPGAFILGPIVAILSIVPYLALVGIPIAVSLLWLQGFPEGSFRNTIWWTIGAPVAMYFIGQALDDYVLTPKIQGKSTGMDTPTILFASLAGGALFGVFGLLIAIPLAACTKILIQEIFWPRFNDWAEGRAADPLPID